MNGKLLLNIYTADSFLSMPSSSMDKDILMQTALNSTPTTSEMDCDGSNYGKNHFSSYSELPISKQRGSSFRGILLPSDNSINQVKKSVYRRINSTPHLTTSYDDYLNHYQKLPKMKNIYNVSSSCCSFSPKGSDLKDVKKAFHSQSSNLSNTSNSTVKGV